jgi:hypothetical protein
VSDSNVIKLAQPGAFTDSLTEIVRHGARALLTQAVEAEVTPLPNAQEQCGDGGCVWITHT